MMQRVRRIDVMQMAKTLAALYLLLGLIIGAPILMIMSTFSGMGAGTGAGIPGLGRGLGIGMFILVPVIYGAMGFIGGALVAAVYNVVAGWTGGIRIDLEQA